MKKQDIVDYLSDNCICDPNNKMDDMNYSICLMKCKASWHWSWEIQRTKLLHALPEKFDPKIDL